jgi:hypothetical protein
LPEVYIAPQRGSDHAIFIIAITIRENRFFAVVTEERISLLGGTFPGALV